MNSEEKIYWKIHEIFYVEAETFVTFPRAHFAAHEENSELSCLIVITFIYSSNENIYERSSNQFTMQ